MSDSRVMFLIWFVAIAIVVASILIIVEVKVRKKKRRLEEERKNLTPAQKVEAFLAGKKSLREKLNFVGENAKDYFKNEYGASLSSDYSELAKEFNKKGKVLEVEFCKKMFKAYYSNKDFGEDDIGALGELFGKIVKEKEKAPSAPSFLDKVEDGVKDKLMVVPTWVGGYVSARQEKEERTKRIVAREENETTRWVRTAIREGYDRSKLKGMLDDGKRDKKEVEKILEIYDKEVAKGSGGYSGYGSGIAGKIIKKEQDRLDEAEVSHV
ncbi:hypothetical protein K8R30_03665 [archaeon]|nr:hypothetical protein [archaeon]